MSPMSLAATLSGKGELPNKSGASSLLNGASCLVNLWGKVSSDCGVIFFGVSCLCCELSIIHLFQIISSLNQNCLVQSRSVELDGSSDC